MRALVLMVLLVLLLVPAAPAMAAPVPRVQTDTTTASPGVTVSFRVEGFKADRVQVELCGSGGVRTSASCDVAGGGLAVLRNGRGVAIVSVGSPPGDCPCRIRAVGIGTRERAVIPFAVTGVPTRAPARPRQQAASPPVVVSVALESAGLDDRLRSWFGLGGDATLRVVVRNAGEVPLSDAAVLVGAGRDTGGSGVRRALSVIPPGDTETLRVAVDLPGTLLGVPLGRFVVEGEVAGAGSGSAFGTRVTALPVALMAVLLFVALWLLLSVARRLVSRAVGLPWLSAMALTGLALGTSLIVRSWYVGWDDRRTVEVAQASLLDGFEQAARSPVRTPSHRPGDLVSVLRLPSLGQVLAVVEGVTPEQLRRAPGHYPGTAAPGQIGNAVVIGHSGSSAMPFDELSRLKPGDPVVLETAQRSHRYTVTGVRRVPATATEVLLPVRGRPGAQPISAQLTLVTCSYEQGVVDGRWVIEARLAQEVA